jgi:hypothetical protein
VTVSAAIKVSLLFTLISIQCVWIIIVTWIEASDSKCRDQGNFTIHTNIYSVWIIKLRGLRQVTVNVAIKVTLLSTLISIQCG